MENRGGEPKINNNISVNEEKNKDIVNDEKEKIKQENENYKIYNKKELRKTNKVRIESTKADDAKIDNNKIFQKSTKTDELKY